MTAPVKLTKAGYYTYRESIADTPAYAAFTGSVRGRTPRRRSRARSPTLVDDGRVGRGRAPGRGL